MLGTGKVALSVQLCIVAGVNEESFANLASESKFINNCKKRKKNPFLGEADRASHLSLENHGLPRVRTFSKILQSLELGAG